MNGIDTETDAVRSLEIGSITQLFEDATFPMTTDEALAAVADVEITSPIDRIRSGRSSRRRITRPARRGTNSSWRFSTRSR